MTTILYARVSRDDLFCENQKRVLFDWAKREGIPTNELWYFHEEMTTRKTRPVKEHVIKLYREGKADTIVCTKIDRFARSLQELVMDVESIINSNGRFVAITNGMDFKKETYNASQQLMLNIFASFAQFEREIIRERTLEGLARVKAQGKKLGRPSKNGIIYTNPNVNDVKELTNAGFSISVIAQKLNTSRNRVLSAQKQINKTPIANLMLKTEVK